MNMQILEPLVSNDLIAKRRELGIDRSDEVWDGVYVMPPLANNDHQDIINDLVGAISEVVRTPGLGRVQPGANVSDREDDWEHNFRCPDVVVVLNDGSATDRKTHWQGGPDFLVEVRSPGDDTLKKLDFYATLGVRELLVIERDSRAPSLLRLARGRLSPIPTAKFEGEDYIVSEVLPLAFRLGGSKRLGPKLEVCRTDGTNKTWLV